MKWNIDKLKFVDLYMYVYIQKQEDWVLCRVFYKNREEIVKGGSSSSNYYDDTAASSCLPELMDSYISFEQPPSSAKLEDDDHDNHNHDEQVPCFSINTNPNHPINSTHMIMMTNNINHPNKNINDHHHHNNNNNNATITTSTYVNGGGSSSALLPINPNHLDLDSSSINATNGLLEDPFSCDTKVLKAVLTQLTKMETNPIITTQKPSPLLPLPPQYHQNHHHQPQITSSYFSHLNSWNNNY